MTLRLREVVHDVSIDRVAFIFRDYFLLDLEPSDVTSHPRRPESSVKPPWKARNSRLGSYYNVGSDLTSAYSSVFGYSSQTSIGKLEGQTKQVII